jgi:HPt (histidine-containing phosphotransfer) domain-containing protein
MRALAHRFLSATQNIGAQRLTQLCVELEYLAKCGQIGQTGPLLADLSRERDLAHSALQALRMRY